jgi:O-antigen/teichoic acid export membrane protein
VRSGRVARRAAWGVADQMLSSATNFAMGVFVARSATPAEFGVYGLIFATYLIALNVARPLSTEPLLIRFTGAASEAWAGAVRGAAGAVVVVSTILGAVCVTGGLIVGGFVGNAFVILGVGLPGLLLQDAWRLAFFGRGDDRAALLNDLVWAGLLFPIIAMLLIAGLDAPLPLVAAWELSAAVAAVVGIRQMGIAPHPGAARRWLTEQRDLGRPLLADRMATNGVAELAPYAIGAIAGLEAVGAIRAAQLLFGPFNVIFQGLSLISLPEAVRLAEHPRGRLLPVAIVFTAGLVVLAIATGIFLSLLPDSVGEALLGQSWPSAQAIIPPYTLVVAGSMFGAGPNVGLRALGAAVESMRVGIVRSVLLLSGTLVGATVAAASGAALGMAAGQWIGNAISWLQLGISTNHANAAPAGRPSTDPLG